MKKLEGRKRKAEMNVVLRRRPAGSRGPRVGKLSDLGEFGLIDRIRALPRPADPSTMIGIGDDAAMARLSPGHLLLVTTDLLLEQVHFDLSYTDYYSLGWKSAAVNLSDIAAMGGTPRFSLTALGIPPKTASSDVLDFYRGFNALLRAHGTGLVGGDTCSSPDGLFVSVTVIGEARRSMTIQRGGARPGDRIFVTGTLGDSAAGLEMLQKRKANTRMPGESPAMRSAVERVVKRHLRPEPRVVWGRKLAVSRCASAMIDVSDGLSSDLAHICRQSNAGADVLIDRIPRSPSLCALSPFLSRSAMEYAVRGGEDYELLFTVPPRRLERLRSLRLPVTEIGTIVSGDKMSLVDGSGCRKPLIAAGYDHFREAAPARSGRKQKVQ